VGLPLLLAAACAGARPRPAAIAAPAPTAAAPADPAPDPEAALSDRPLFYEIEFRRDGQLLAAKRGPIYGVEVPSVSYPPGYVPPPAPQIDLSPLAVGEAPMEGQGPWTLPLLPGRGAAAARLEVRVRLASGPAVEARWRDKLAGETIGPPTGEWPRDPRQELRVCALLAPTPEQVVEVMGFFDRQATVRPARPTCLRTLPRGGELVFDFALPAGPAGDLHLFGDGLELVVVGP
jgi:hypothetical protein